MEVPKMWGKQDRPKEEAKGQRKGIYLFQGGVFTSNCGWLEFG